MGEYITKKAHDRKNVCTMDDNTQNEEWCQ